MAVNREAVVATAEKLVARGKIDGAIKEYRKLVADNPGDAMTINRLGDLYVRINRNEEAVKLFLQIADRYTEDGFFVKAIAIFKKIIKLDPTRLPVYERLAELYHKQGLVTEARTQYQVLVDYYLKHGKIDAAEGVLRKMTALDSGDPTPHVKLAEIFRDRGEHDKELHEYKQLAEMMLRHKRIDEAAQVYAKAIAAAPTDLGFITDAVLGLKDAGQPAAAARLLAIAVEKNPQAEKIARIAGIGDKKKLETTGVRTVETEGGRVLKVSDVASAPAELRSGIAPRLDPPRSETLRADAARAETSRPDAGRSSDFLLDEIDLELPAAGPRGVPRAATPAAPPPGVEPWLPPGTDESELEFVLEIEGEAVAEPPTKSASSAAPPAADSAPPEVAEIDWSFEPEPALELDFELPVVEPPKPAAPPTRAPAPEAPADLDVAATAPISIPKPAPAPPPAPAPAARRLADLLAEAEVFRKHGLAEKAHDRLRTILAEEPKHAGALSLATLLNLDEGKLERAYLRAQQLERLAGESPASGEAWEALRPKLEKAGFRFDAGALAAPPEPKKAKQDSVSLLLDELAGLKAKPATPAARKSAKADDFSALVDGLAAATKPKPAAAPRALPEIALPEIARPKPATTPSAPPIAASAVPGTPATPARTPTPPIPPPPADFDAVDEAIDDKLSWLDEAAARAASKPAAAARGKAPGADDLFADEEGFFDLAAELEEELSKEDIGAREALSHEEPSLEEIVEGFKKGVAESLSAEDYDTHFNLGIAYREMGLLDEAIGEFQLAAKHENYLLDCCTLLGGCFLEKGLPELAVKWYQRGLATPNLTEDANLGLLYDLGNLYFAVGDEERARRTFVELYGINSNYRDVVAKLEELG